MLTKAISFGSGIHAAAADTRPIELPENLGGAGEHRDGHEGPATGPGTADHDALPAIEPDDHRRSPRQWSRRRQQKQMVALTDAAFVAVNGGG